METKPTARELLQDTLADLVWIAGAYSDSKSIIDNSNAAYKMACTARARREIIESYLTAPSENAIELVERIRETNERTSSGYTITDFEAAELIEGLQRTVPRKMLDEVVKKCWPMGNGPMYDKAMDMIAAEYGVAVE